MFDELILFILSMRGAYLNAAYIIVQIEKESRLGKSWACDVLAEGSLQFGAKK